ncbi:MAG: Allergen V5/Tpx-1 family [Geobacteraceae bacterium]|nr:MAG: Allergen V5/Tpx-1 family [Geobacteraceae bacterium]
MMNRLVFTRSVVLACILLLSVTVERALSAPEKPVKEVSKPEQEEPVPGDCLTDDEAELARLVNKLRNDNGLPAIRVTGSLYKVAKWHVIDLVTAPHKDKTDGRGLPCDLHRWSEKGEGRGGWKPVCYTADHKYAKAMWDKPREITDYMGDGYEIVYWTSAPLSPSMVISFWENRKFEKDLILEHNAWKNSKWNVMGVGIYGNYAAVWFGGKPDHEGVVGRCEKH